VEDVFVGRTGLTLSGDYQATFDGRRTAWEQICVTMCVGRYINVAPVVSYRHLETNRYSTDGVNLGARLLLVLSRRRGEIFL